MSTKKSLEIEARQTEREIQRLQRDLKQKRDEIENLRAPERVRNAEPGDILSEGSMLLSVHWTKYEGIAILAKTTEDFYEFGEFGNIIKNHNEFLPSKEFFIPFETQYKFWTSDEVIAIVTEDEVNFHQPRNGERAYFLICKVVKCSPHQCYDEIHSY
jgi:hypothetical protein